MTTEVESQRKKKPDKCSVSSCDRLQSARKKKHTVHLEESEKRGSTRVVQTPTSCNKQRNWETQVDRKNKGVTELTQWSLQQTRTSWAPFTLVRNEETQNMADTTAGSITRCSTPSPLRRKTVPRQAFPTKCLKHVPMSKYQPIHVPADNEAQNPTQSQQSNVAPQIRISTASGTLRRAGGAFSDDLRPKHINCRGSSSPLDDDQENPNTVGRNDEQPPARRNGAQHYTRPHRTSQTCRHKGHRLPTATMSP